jgi:uncharacterized repeat protein (TIGR03803 family)
MNSNKFWVTASKALAVVTVMLSMTLMLAPGAWAQSKYKTLYKFSGGKDGKFPQASLIFDQAGNLYGTTAGGGAHQWGIVFQLVPNLDGSWKENVLHQFTGGEDGANPQSSVIFDQAGNLYGTTTQGGTCVFKNGCGGLQTDAEGGWNLDGERAPFV